MNILEIAALANLELSPAEAQALEQDLTSILDYIGQLTALDTTGVEPRAHALEVEAVLRADQSQIWFEQKQALSNAPAAAHGMFQVPRIIDRG